MQRVAMDVDESATNRLPNANINGTSYRMRPRGPTSQFSTTIIERNRQSVTGGDGSWRYGFASHVRNHGTHAHPINSIYGPVHTGPRVEDGSNPAQTNWFNENLGWVMTNNGVWNNRANRYGPNDPRGNRESYRYVHSIYTMFRTWLRKGINILKYKRKRIPEILGDYNRAPGGATQRVFTRYTEQADAEYLRSLRGVVGTTARDGESLGNTINVFHRRSARSTAGNRPQRFGF
jgi:hypothetical protein